MKLTIGQKKAVVTAYIFGLNEINSNAYSGIAKLGLVIPWEKGKPGKLSPLGEEVARGLIENRNRTK